MSPRPNILLITTDQQRWDHLGLAGMRGIKTPALDRLGNEGVHVEKAYCPSPICTPTRMSLLTGQYPSSHGAYTIGVTVEPFPTQTLPATLSADGYHTAVVGKTHFVRRADEEAHMAGMANPPAAFWRSWSGPYAGFDYVQSSIGHTTDANPNQHYRTWLEDKGVDWKPWFPQSRGEPHTPYDAGAWDIPADCHDTEWVTQICEQFIENHNAEKPWFCWASYQDPHAPILCPEPWYSSVDMSEVETFDGAREGEFDDKPELYKAIHANQPNYTDGIGLPCAYTGNEDPEHKRRELQATLGMVAFIDHGVGRLLDRLEATGQLDNTLVIFTSDHGEYHGHHGFWGKGLPAYDDGQRVPLLLRGAGVKARGTHRTLANVVDLPKTILDFAGTPIPRGTQGNSLKPMLLGEVDSVQDAVLVECRPIEHGVYQQSFITQTHKLVVYQDEDFGELYDTVNDPDQYKNLWDDPEHAPLKSELLHRFVRFNMQKDGHTCPRTAFA